MKKNNIIAVFFIGLISTAFLIMVFKHISITLGWSKLIIDSNWKSQREVKGNTIEKLETTLENIKINLDNRTHNYFPLYYSINSIFNKSNKELNRLLFKDKIPMGKNTDGEYLFLGKDHYFLNTSMKKEEILNRTIKHSALYNNINNDIPVFIYLPHRYEFQNNINKNNFVDMNSILKLFKKELNPNIKVGELLVYSKEEYLNNFYKTDHHWTCEGASRGYSEIMKLMEIKKYFKDFKCVKETDKYLGSFANKLKDNSIFDTFSYIKSNLEYEIFIDGIKKDDKLMEKKIERMDNFYDYYVGFHNGFYGEVIYDFNNNKDNLLIIADSYSWAIDEIIAANFNKTYVINVMFGDYSNFNIKKYIKENKIDKILVLQETPTTVYDVFNHGILEKLVK